MATKQTEALNAVHGMKEKIVKSMTINRPVAEVYQFWRNLENLPQFMTHIESIHPMGDRKSHWVIKGPGGARFEWDAEILDEKENQYIAWRSVGSADVDNAGCVQFEEAPAKQGTDLTVILGYNPPAGKAGKGLVSFLGAAPEHELEHDLKQLKQVLEGRRAA